MDSFCMKPAGVAIQDFIESDSGLLRLRTRKDDYGIGVFRWCGGLQIHLRSETQLDGIIKIL